MLQRLMRAPILRARLSFLVAQRGPDSFSASSLVLRNPGVISALPSSTRAPSLSPQGWEIESGSGEAAEKS